MDHLLRYFLLTRPFASSLSFDLSFFLFNVMACCFNFLISSIMNVSSSISIFNSILNLSSFWCDKFLYISKSRALRPMIRFRISTSLSRQKIRSCLSPMSAISIQSLLNKLIFIKLDGTGVITAWI